MRHRQGATSRFLHNADAPRFSFERSRDREQILRPQAPIVRSLVLGALALGQDAPNDPLAGAIDQGLEFGAREHPRASA
jgi:hypothetical protein